MECCFCKFAVHQIVTCTLLQMHLWGFFENFQKSFLRATLDGYFCQGKVYKKLSCFVTYPRSWLKLMIINFVIIFILKISVVKCLSVKKQRKVSKVFPCLILLLQHYKNVCAITLVMWLRLKPRLTCI